MIHNVLLIHDGGLLFFWFNLRHNLSTCVQISVPILRLSSLSCLHTQLADLWSLNGSIVCTSALFSSHVCFDQVSLPLCERRRKKKFALGKASKSKKSGPKKGRRKTHALIKRLNESLLLRFQPGNSCIGITAINF